MRTNHERLTLGVDYVVVEDIPGWYDSLGPEFDCIWYGQNNDNNCVDFGNDPAYKNFGFMASQACTVCGGGIQHVHKTCWYDMEPSSCFWSGEDCPLEYEIDDEKECGKDNSEVCYHCCLQTKLICGGPRCSVDGVPVDCTDPLSTFVESNIVETKHVGIVTSASSQNATDIVPFATQNATDIIPDATRTGFSMIHVVGMIVVATSILLCCWAYCVHIQMRKKYDQSQKQKLMLSIFESVQKFDIDDIDVRQNLSGGYNVTYLNNLDAHGGKQHQQQQHDDEVSITSLIDPRESPVADSYLFLSTGSIKNQQW